MVISKKDEILKKTKKIGKLTPLYRIEDRITPSGQKIAFWKCRCDCGNEVEVSREHLINGNIKSCGCYKKICLIKDLTNQKFGHLKALYRIEGTNNWHCKCDCGNEVDIPTSLLTQGKKTTCGCHKTVTQYTLEGDKIKTYKNMQEAADSVGLTRQCISEAIKKKVKIAGGYIWSKTNMDTLPQDELVQSKRLFRIGKPIPSTIKNKKDRRVIQYDRTGKPLKIFSSVKDASKLTNISKETIYYNIKNKSIYNLKKSDEFIWKYEEV